MTTEELVAELEPLTHAARIRQMVELGQRAAADASVAALLAALETGDFYQRWLALQSCYGSRDGAHALRALSDPSRIMRKLAIKLISLAADDAQAQAALEMLPPDLGRVLLRKLLHHKRRAPIDAFITALAGHEDTRLLLLLPFSSAEVVRGYVERVLPSGGYDDWHRLARFHPEIAGEALLRRAEAAERLDQRLAWQANAALPFLADTRPDQALAVARALLRQVSLAQLHLQRLALRRPNEVADLALGTDDQARVDFAPLAHRLEVGRLRALVERGALRANEGWFKRLAPALRVALYAVGQHGWRDKDGCLAYGLVALLPRDLREQEGRRHLALPALATRPEQRLRYAAFLPWDEAVTALDPFARHPDPDLRAVALRALVATVRFHRERLSDLLAALRARRNEQDPVRQAMLGELARLPPGRWREEHLEGLGLVIRDALDAADLSNGTAQVIGLLLVGVLKFHPAWSAAWIATLAQERGQLTFYNLEDRLSDEDARRIAPALLPVLHSWETRERETYLILAAESFGRRLRVFDALVEIVERVLRETRASWVASRALGALYLYRRERLAALVPALIEDDPSWATVSAVYTYLHRHRQDVITPFLGQRAYKGRFSTGKTRFVLPLSDGFFRWTPTQQATFAETLTQVTRDEVRDTPALRQAISQLAALPAVAPTRLMQLARLENPKAAIRDLALRALGRLDAGQGIAALLEAMGDDRARIAIYALRVALLEMPASRAVELLRAVPLERVTVAKEVVRLLGELPGEAGYADLLALDGRELHRDVRVALLRAFWDHLERDETWPILERAARSPDAAIAAGVVRIPADRLSPEAQRRLAALLAALLAHPDSKVRLDTLLRCAQLPLSDSEQVLLAPFFAAVASPLPDERTAAAAAIFATYAGRDAAMVGKAVEQILAKRRALMALAQALQTVLAQGRSRLLPTARAVLVALAADPLTAALRVDLAAQALPWDELAAFFAALAAAGELHSEVLLSGVWAIGRAASRPDAAGLAALEAALAGSEDERLRRLALAALVALAGPPRGWDEERLARLRAYRADSAALVAAAAQFTFPPVEEEISG